MSPESARSERAAADPTSPRRHDQNERQSQEENNLEPITEVLQLLRRQSAIQRALRRSSNNRVLAERELYLIRQRLARYPAACQAIAHAAAELHRPVETLSVRDVEQHH